MFFYIYKKFSLKKYPNRLGHQFQYSSFAGVYTALMTIVLISWVVFYRRFGFCTAMLILTKPGKLTDEEFAIMKSHAARGYEILKDIKIQEDIAAGAHHHERYDGKGYPDGLSGENIPWVARIIAVADTFDAMSSNRPYRDKLPLTFIVEEIENCAGSQFDPIVVKAFLALYIDGAFSALANQEAAVSVT